MTLEDAEHYTPEKRAEIIASYPEHERDARSKGIPVLGSGLVFPVRDEAITCDAFAIPDHWRQIGGMDFGWDHPFAGSKLAHDGDNDIIYVTAEYRVSRETPVIHAAALRPWGDWLPWAWPHDGLQHDKHSGDELAAKYREQDLNMLPEHATHEAGGYGVEAGVTDILDRMRTNRWKVFRHLTDWLGERRGYHRVKGIIVKENEDLICSSRYALMMLRYAETTPKPKASRRRSGEWGWG